MTVPDSRGRRAREEAGSILLLIPAGVLIVLALAAIAIDTAAVFLAQREAESAATAAANDIAALAIDPIVLRDEGVYFIEVTHLEAVSAPATAAIVAQLSAVFVPGSVAVQIERLSDTEILVTVTGDATRVIGPLGTAGVGASTTVTASAVGVASG